MKNNLLPILYMPVIKTGNAELNGLSNLSENVKNSITPLFELTKYRKTTIKDYERIRNVELPLKKRLDKIEICIGKDTPFFLDLTGDEKLSNDKIKELQNSKNGYCAWIEFLKEQKQRFPKIIPVLQVSDEGSNDINESKKNLKIQIENLLKNYKYFLYRFSVSDLYYKEDLNEINSVCSNQNDKDKILCCIDTSFIEQKQGVAFASIIYKMMLEINENYKIDKFIISGTSFPHIIPSGKEFKESGQYEIEELKLFDELKNKIKQLNKSALKLYYSDYACINPQRTDIMTRGWIPRIDCPDKKTWFFYRKRKGDLRYSEAYEEVAKLMRDDERYDKIKKVLGNNNWGIQQIEEAANGLPGGLSPSFWISVRVNLAISLRAITLS